jgi:hypothetical protein
MRSTLEAKKVEALKLAATTLKEQKALGDKTLADMTTQVDGLLKNVLPGDKVGFAEAMGNVHKTMSMAQQINSNYTPEQVDLFFENKLRSVQTPEMKLLLEDIETKRKATAKNDELKNQATTPEQDRNFSLKTQEFNQKTQKDATDRAQGNIKGSQPTIIKNLDTGEEITSSYIPGKGYLLGGGYTMELPSNYQRITTSAANQNLNSTEVMGVPTTDLESKALFAAQKNIVQPIQKEYINVLGQLKSARTVLNQVGGTKGIAKAMAITSAQYNIAKANNGVGVLTNQDFRTSTGMDNIEGIVENYRKFVTNSYSPSTIKEMEMYTNLQEKSIRKGYQRKQILAVKGVLDASMIDKNSDKYKALEQKLVFNTTGIDISKKESPGDATIYTTNNGNKVTKRKVD